jgi:hypothetical protein
VGLRLETFQRWRKNDTIVDSCSASRPAARAGNYWRNSVGQPMDSRGNLPPKDQPESQPGSPADAFD